MNPIVPQQPGEEQPAPPSPGFVVLPEVVQERTAEDERIQIAAKVWAFITFERLTRAQAAIDWSRDAGALLMAMVRTHQRVGVRFLLWSMLGWLSWWVAT